MSLISKVPTNIVTGFLGTGKTTTILEILKNKPQHEKWAVLVNEFGDIGIDSSIFINSNVEKPHIREVVGGCMCCVSGLSMKVALNDLLKTAQPDRLIIEPTGLGHPVELIKILRSEYYKNVLELYNTITLIDARNLSDERYIHNEIFEKQVLISDIILANKCDYYDHTDKTLLRKYIESLKLDTSIIHYTNFGKIDLDLLYGKTNNLSQKLESISQLFTEKNKAKDPDYKINFSTRGWRYAPTHVFSKEKFDQFIQNQQITRLKAVLITDEGIFIYNKVSNKDFDCIEVDECDESRVEIIDERILDNFQSVLETCLLTDLKG